MESLPGYQTSKTRAFYRPHGCVSAGELADMIAAALQRARNENRTDVLINISGMTGFETPGPAFRRWAVQRWAEVVESDLRVAMVARMEHICPCKTGLLVAAEEGLHAGIFISEDQALDWLDTPTISHPHGDSSAPSSPQP